MLRLSLSLMVIGAFLTGCTTPPPAIQSAVPMAKALGAYEDRNLAASLFPQDEAVLSGEALDTILSAQIHLPDQMRMAIVRFGQLPYWWGWSEDFVRMNEQLDRDFLARLSSSPRIGTALYMPSLVTPHQMTLPHLRQAAARLQADVVLIYRTSTRTYERQRLFRTDETRAYCTVEAILFDTRTGIIPFSTVVTEKFSAQRSKEDYDFDETIAKASQQAIARAWLRLAEETSAFLRTAAGPGEAGVTGE